jgi:hypothetical protein
MRNTTTLHELAVDLQFAATLRILDPVAIVPLPPFLTNLDRIGTQAKNFGYHVPTAEELRADPRSHALTVWSRQRIWPLALQVSVLGALGGDFEAPERDLQIVKEEALKRRCCSKYLSRYVETFEACLGGAHVHATVAAASNMLDQPAVLSLLSSSSVDHFTLALLRVAVTFVDDHDAAHLPYALVAAAIGVGSVDSFEPTCTELVCRLVALFPAA